MENITVNGINLFEFSIKELEAIKDTRAKIKNGTYILTDLNK